MNFSRRASEAYGAYGLQTSKWYEWSVRVLGARLALRRGALEEAAASADEILRAGAPPFDALQATLIAAEAFVGAGRVDEAAQRLASAADVLDPKIAPAAWGEYLRLRGALNAKTSSAADAYHDFAQSATLLDLLGERYQAALSHLALGRLVAETGARSTAERHLNQAFAVFDQLGAERDLSDTREAQRLLTTVGSGEYVLSPADADDAIVRRIVDAAALPDLLGRETAAALFEAAAADCAVIYVELPGDTSRDRVSRLRRRCGARACALRVARHRVWARRDPGRADGPRPRRSALRARRLAATDRPPGTEARSHDCRRRAPGFRLVRGARALDRRTGRARRRSIARTGAARISIAPARR